MEDEEFNADVGQYFERLFERHLSMSHEWFPHELVPWSRGRDFEPNETFDPREYPLDDAVRSALIVNLLTEDNLPYYFGVVDDMFGADGIWGEWARRWTAEEARHATVIRDYLMVTRAVDPIALERSRMAVMSTGFRFSGSPLEGCVYGAFQELATRIAHRNTGKRLPDPVGFKIMAKVAADENLHFLVYRDLVSAGIEANPSAAVIVIERQVRRFEMPGMAIPGFKAHALAISRAGIYDLASFYEHIVEGLVLRHWQLEHLTGLNPVAEQAREQLLVRASRLERLAHRREDARAQASAEREDVVGAGTR